MDKDIVSSTHEMNDPDDLNDYYEGFIFDEDHLNTCPHCNGKGYTQFTNHCNTCDGTGDF